MQPPDVIQRSVLPSVLVADVNALGMIGVLRSLGRAGYRVHGYSSNPEALGFASKFNSHPILAPSYSDQHFVPWLRTYLEAHAIDALVPTEACLLALLPHLDEFRALLPLLPPRSTLELCFSKVRVVESFLEASDSKLTSCMPVSGTFHRDTALLEGDAVRELGMPMWIKGDAIHHKAVRGGVVKKAASLEEALGTIAGLLNDYEALSAQSHVSAPVQVGANFLIDGNEVLAESMMVSLHDNPHTGGTSGLRRTFRHEAIRDDALRRLRHLGWRGVAMVEYKWDPATDAFFFIELNPRFWAGLHLDLYAEVDYPRLLLDRHFGLPVAFPVRPRRDITARWTLPTDFGHMLSKMRDSLLPLRKRMWAPLEFLLLFLAPNVRDDLRFPGDERLYWKQWRQLLKN